MNMLNTNEYILAQKTLGLINSDNKNEIFKFFNEIYEIISENDFNGRDLYLILENMNNGKAMSAFELYKFLDELFLRYNWYEVDKLCDGIGIGRYMCWNRFTDVIYCIQPILFHLCNDKEFLGNWNCITMSWE